jgi:hypothetical protein
MRKNKEKGDGLNGRIQQFVEQNPGGWSDEDWVRFLAELGEAGLDTSDPDALGLELERARLLRRLQTANIKGLGPRRIATVAERYGTLWNVQRAEVEELRTLPGFNRQIAEALKSAVG